MKLFSAALLSILFSTSANAHLVACTSQSISNSNASNVSVQAAFEFIPTLSKDGQATISQVNGSILYPATFTQTTYQLTSVDADGLGKDNGYPDSFQFSGIQATDADANADTSDSYSSSSSSSEVSGAMMMVPRAAFADTKVSLQINVFLDGTLDGNRLLMNCSMND